jgi:hypothetical protein
MRRHATAIQAISGNPATPAQLGICAPVGAPVGAPTADRITSEPVITKSLRRRGVQNSEELLIEYVHGRWFVDAEREIVPSCCDS